MRVMVLIKASPESEAGMPPPELLVTAMHQYNQALTEAGVLLAAQGLQASSRGCRVRVEGPHHQVVDGPFTESKELIAGFWLWQVRSMEEAIEWVKRCPNPLGQNHEVEIRPVFEGLECAAPAAARH